MNFTIHNSLVARVQKLSCDKTLSCNLQNLTFLNIVTVASLTVATEAEQGMKIWRGGVGFKILDLKSRAIPKLHPL